MKYCQRVGISALPSTLLSQPQQYYFNAYKEKREMSAVIVSKIKLTEAGNFIGKFVTKRRE